MGVIVARTVTVVGGGDRGDGGRSDALDGGERSHPLGDFRPERSYVLLGDPGAGKTTAFKEEANAEGHATFVTARRFIRGRIEDHPAWENRTLYIDGLDEVRAGRRDARGPLDRILERLEELGRPRFRLSCRAADWLGRSDAGEIVSTKGYKDLKILHLDPLANQHVQEIARVLGVPDVPSFLAQAHQSGIEGMLHNPLLLELLAKASGADELPDDRLGTLEAACRKLTQEWNEEHQAGHRSAPAVPVERIMDAAGHLSALLLLSDRDRVSLDPPEDANTLSPEDIPDGDQRALQRALKSNLFAVDRDGYLDTVHRHIAEFLGARFLDGRITSRHGVPASRVLSLMTGEDGVVVTELRGLSAWLAAFNADSRRYLIETDPIGVALHGDVGRFRGGEMEDLLRALAERADEIDAWSWPPVVLASLIDRTTLQVLSRYLADDDRTDGRQAVVHLLLQAMCRDAQKRTGGSRRSPAALAANLEETVRDSTWQPRLRSSALRALVRCAPRDVATLISLLDAARDGRVKDEEWRLRATLLEHLYPDHVGPERIWDYWEPREAYGPVGRPGMYRYQRLIERTDDSDVLTLLRALVDLGPKFREGLAGDLLLMVIQRLVRRALAAAGDEADVSTVYDWLELVDVHSLQARRPESVAVSRWLAGRPDLQKRLTLEGLDRVSGSGAEEADETDVVVGHRGRWFQVQQIIFGARRPEDFPAWCLRQAVDATATRIEVALELLEKSQPWHQGHSDKGLSIEEVQSATEPFPKLRRRVELLIQGREELPEERQFNEEVKEFQRKERREKDQFIEAVRERIADLKAGECSPGILHHLAVSYHAFFGEDRISSPRQRVAKLLGEDIHLTEAALEGFRRVIERDDLPTLRELIRLDEQEKMSYLALPILAGLDLVDPESLEDRSVSEITRAAGLYYLTTLNVQKHPKWYRKALRSHPESVAEALIKVTRSRVRRRQNSLYLWHLGREEAHEEVARRASPHLLRAFPTRCTEPQISALQELLLAAIRWKVKGTEDILRQKVANSDLDVAQRALWLAADLFLSPAHGASQLVEFVERGEEARSRHVVRFLAPSDMDRLPMLWGSGELQKLIALLGSRYTPWRPKPSLRAEVVDEERTRAEGLIAGWAATLASRTDSAACQALQDLVEDPNVQPWHLLLRRRRDEQILARRSATFSTAYLSAVQATLSNKAPANATDLAAVIVDRLEELGKRIRRGNTDDWRQYWNEDPRGQPSEPKHEESCRDALLSALRPTLPDGVDAQPEAHYARSKRTDIRVSFKGHAIPVEVKKDSNQRLWSAVDNQLVRKYTIDPESSGFGIYLVLWFGQGRGPVPPTGRRPKTPEELRERLEAQLDGPSRHRIRVVVIDVSGDPPGDPMTARRTSKVRAQLDDAPWGGASPRRE